MRCPQSLPWERYPWCCITAVAAKATKVVAKDSKKRKSKRRRHLQGVEGSPPRHWCLLQGREQWASWTPGAISILLKFINSEKATKFCKISSLLLSYVLPVKSMVEDSQNFVAFSEYMNFTNYLFECITAVASKLAH